MAIDFSKLYSGVTKGDLASIEAAAQKISSNASVFGALGNVSPVNGAKSALQAIANVKKIQAGQAPAKSNQGTDMLQYNLDRAHGFLTGSLTPTKYANFNTRANGSYQSLLGSLTNESENLANMSATTAPGTKGYTPAQIAKQQAKVKKLQDQANQISTFFGVEAPTTTLKQDASGNFVNSTTTGLTPPPVVPGAVPGGPMTDLQKNAPETLVAPKREQFTDENSYQNALQKFNQTGNWATPAPVTPNPSSQATAVIPFKDGLTDVQKQGITTLASKPTAQWNETDLKNWNYATNNAPPPGSGSITTAMEPKVSQGPFQKGSLPSDMRPLTSDYKATLQKEAPETLIAPQRSSFRDDASFQTALDRFNTFGYWATEAPNSSITDNTVPFKAGLSEVQKKGIQDLIDSGKVFNETDAKNYAYATGQTDYQQFIGKTGADLKTSSPDTTLGTGEKLLTPSEYDSYRKQLGATDTNFDQYFRRDNSGNIYLKADALKQGGDFSAGSPGQTVGADLTSSSTGGKDLTIPPAVAADPDSFIASLNTILNYKSPDELALEKKRTDMENQLTTDLAAEANKGADLQKALDKSGVNTMTAQLQDLNMQIAQKIGNYNAGGVKIMNQAIPEPLLIGQQAALKAQAAADIGLLTAQAQALQNNIGLATDLAKQSVDLMYADEEQRIQNTQTLLDLNKQDLSTEESRSASKIQVMLDERQRILDEQKAETQQNADLMLAVAKAGGDTSLIDIKAPFTDNLKKVSSFLDTSPKFYPATKYFSGGTFDPSTGTFTPLDGSSGGGFSTAGSTSGGGSSGGNSSSGTSSEASSSSGGGGGYSGGGNGGGGGGTRTVPVFDSESGKSLGSIEVSPDFTGDKVFQDSQTGDFKDAGGSPVSAAPPASTSASGPTTIPADLKPYVRTTLDGKSFINAANLPARNTKAYNQLEQEAANNGIPIFTKEASASIETITTALLDLESIENSADNFLPKSIADVGTIARNTWDQVTHNNDRGVVAYQAFISSIVPLIQALGSKGSGLRITQPEIDTMKKNIPGMLDNPESAKGKLDTLRTLLINAQNTGTTLDYRSLSSGGVDYSSYGPSGSSGTPTPNMSADEILKAALGQ